MMSFRLMAKNSKIKQMTMRIFEGITTNLKHLDFPLNSTEVSIDSKSTIRYLPFYALKYYDDCFMNSKFTCLYAGKKYSGYYLNFPLNADRNFAIVYKSVLNHNKKRPKKVDGITIEDEEEAFLSIEQGGKYLRDHDLYSFSNRLRVSNSYLDNYKRFQHMDIKQLLNSHPIGLSLIKIYIPVQIITHIDTKLDIVKESFISVTDSFNSSKMIEGKQIAERLFSLIPLFSPPIAFAYQLNCEEFGFNLNYILSATPECYFNTLLILLFTRSINYCLPFLRELKHYQKKPNNDYFAWNSSGLVRPLNDIHKMDGTTEFELFYEKISTKCKDWIELMTKYLFKEKEKKSEESQKIQKEKIDDIKDNILEEQISKEKEKEELNPAVKEVREEKNKKIEEPKRKIFKAPPPTVLKTKESIQSSCRDVKGYYQFFNLPRKEKSSLGDIQNSYINLVKLYHPDKVLSDNKVKANRKFMKINKIYNILKDPIKRAQYDKM